MTYGCNLLVRNHAGKASSCLGPAETQRPLTSRDDKAVVDQKITICHYAKLTLKIPSLFVDRRKLFIQIVHF